MSHQHFCDFAGHHWQCESTALRPLAGQSEPTSCICLNCRIPMEEGDHSQCSVELLACPEHRNEQLRRMGYEPGTANMPQSRDADEGRMFEERDGNPIAGFCLWCNQDFVTMEEVETHNADDMARCPIFQELKNEHCMPPVLQAMFEDANLIDDEDRNEPR